MLTKKSTILYSSIYTIIVPVLVFIQLEKLPDSIMDTMNSIYITCIVALLFPVLLYIFDKQNTKELKIKNLIISYITILILMFIFFCIVAMIGFAIGEAMRNIWGTPT